jgi:hypothetical protein
LPGFQKNLRNEILRGNVLRNPEKYIAIDAFHISVVKLGKRFRITRFGSMNQSGLIR